MGKVGEDEKQTQANFEKRSGPSGHRLRIYEQAQLRDNWSLHYHLHEAGEWL